MNKYGVFICMENHGCILRTWTANDRSISLHRKGFVKMARFIMNPVLCNFFLQLKLYRFLKNWSQSTISKYIGDQDYLLHPKRDQFGRRAIHVKTRLCNLFPNLVTPFPRIETLKCAPTYLTSTIGNKLPEDMKQIKDRGLFKLVIKQMGNRSPRLHACANNDSMKSTPKIRVWNCSWYCTIRVIVAQYIPK